MLNSLLDINGSLADISDFGEDIVLETGSALGGISSHDGSKNDTDSDYITEPSIISAISSSFNRKKLQLYFIQEIVIVNNWTVGTTSSSIAGLTISNNAGSTLSNIV